VGLLDQQNSFIGKVLLHVCVFAILLIRNSSDIEKFKNLADEATFYDKQWNATVSGAVGVLGYLVLLVFAPSRACFRAALRLSLGNLLKRKASRHFWPPGPAAAQAALGGVAAAASLHAARALPLAICFFASTSFAICYDRRRFALQHFELAGGQRYARCAAWFSWCSSRDALYNQDLCPLAPPACSGRARSAPATSKPPAAAAAAVAT